MAQKIITTKKVVVHAPLKAFFERNTGVREVRFADSYYVEQGLVLTLVTIDTPLIDALNEFHLNNPGDRYFFEKEYGRFNFPDSLHKQFTKKMKTWAEVSGTVRSDSVFFTFTQTIYKSDDEKVFVKLERRKDYEGGMHLFAKRLDDSLSTMPVPAGDSILIFRTLLNKDRRMTITEVRLGDSTSAYTKAVSSLIKNVVNWILYDAGGRPVRSYQLLYIRRNPDGSYRVAMD